MQSRNGPSDSRSESKRLFFWDEHKTAHVCFSIREQSVPHFSTTPLPLLLLIAVFLFSFYVQLYLHHLTLSMLYCFICLNQYNLAKQMSVIASQYFRVLWSSTGFSYRRIKLHWEPTCLQGIWWPWIIDHIQVKETWHCDEWRWKPWRDREAAAPQNNSNSNQTENRLKWWSVSHLAKPKNMLYYCSYF